MASPGPATTGQPTADKGLPLDNLAGVRRELASIYRLGRRGQLAIADVARLAHVLDTIRRAIVGDDLEGRLTRLEEERLRL